MRSHTLLITFFLFLAPAGLAAGDDHYLSHLETTGKALKGAIARSQNGIAGLKNISKLGPAALGASSPIFEELKQLEGEAQRLLKTYRDLLNKATLSASMTTPEDQRND